MRFAPLTGLLAVLLTVVAFLLLGDTPSVDAPADEVRTFYEDHEVQGLWSLFMLVIAGALFVFFAAFLARALHESPMGNGWLHHVIVAGGVLIAVGCWVGSSISLALVDLADEAAAGNDTLQALHALSEDFFIPFLAGLAVMLLAAGLTVVRAAVSALPRWMGWIAVVLGVLAFVPWVGFFAFMLAGVWIITVSVLLALRPKTPAKPTGGTNQTPST